MRRTALLRKKKNCITSRKSARREFKFYVNVKIFVLSQIRRKLLLIENIASNRIKIYFPWCDVRAPHEINVHWRSSPAERAGSSVCSSAWNGGRYCSVIRQRVNSTRVPPLPLPQTCRPRIRPQWGEQASLTAMAGGHSAGDLRVLRSGSAIKCGHLMNSRFAMQSTASGLGGLGYVSASISRPPALCCTKNVTV